MSLFWVGSSIWEERSDETTMRFRVERRVQVNLCDVTWPGHDKAWGVEELTAMIRRGQIAHAGILPYLRGERQTSSHYWID